MSQQSGRSSSGEIAIPIDQQMEESKRLVATFRQKNNAAAAKRVLEWMAAQDIDDDDLTESVEWAKSQLPKLSTPEERRQQQQLFTLRKAQVLAGTDLDEATRLLSTIPESEYSKETQEFALGLSARREALGRFRKKLELAVQQQNDAQAGQLIRGILELSPTDPVALSLKKKGIGGRKAASGTIKSRGNLSFWEYHWKDARFRRATFISGALFFVLFAVTFSSASYLKGLSKRPVKIEVNDNLTTVSIDNQPVSLEMGVATTAVRPGKHSLTIRRGDEILETRSFEVIRDQSPVLKVMMVGDPTLARAPVGLANRSIPSRAEPVDQASEPAVDLVEGSNRNPREGKTIVMAGASTGGSPVVAGSAPPTTPVVSAVPADRSVAPVAGPNGTLPPTNANANAPAIPAPGKRSAIPKGFSKLTLKGTVDDFVIITFRQRTVTYRRASGSPSSSFVINGTINWDAEKNNTFRHDAFPVPINFGHTIQTKLSGRATVNYHRYPTRVELHIRDGAGGAAEFELEFLLMNKK